MDLTESHKGLQTLKSIVVKPSMKVTKRGSEFEPGMPSEHTSTGNTILPQTATKEKHK